MKRSAFTLVELLTVIAIIAVVATIGGTAVKRMQQQGNLAREVSAARQLVASYLASAAENNGELMPGYASSADGIHDDRGNELHYPASGRYPWRLARYLQGRVKGTLIVNEQVKLTENKEHSYYTYVVSLLPSFGINATFVGGNETSSLSPTRFATSRYGQFCVTNVLHAVKASSLVVFASSHFSEKGEGEYGYHLIEPPATNSRQWARKYHKSLPPKATGYVHFRYDGKAVTAMLDGHVELLDFEQLEDMRRWSNQAAELNEPDFVLSTQ